jgi:Transposase DDE domain./Transposase domain (DUF772).
MLKSSEQSQMNISPYMDLYDLIIDKDNFWRQLNELVDFSFIYAEIKDNYSDSIGRPAENPIRMLKYILLKTAFKLSDRDLVRNVKTDMQMKYFLEYSPEETNLINPSSLTKFRRLRLKDTNLLDLMIEKTIEIAIENGVLEIENKLIVDSTHTNARFQHISPREDLLKRAKELRKAVYAIDASMKDKMPKKKDNTGILEDIIDYGNDVILTIEKEGGFQNCTEVMNRLDYLKEGIDDINTAKEYSKDSDARIGHKSADSNFFGYKTHIAITPERLISAATITTGEKHDGKELKELVKKSEKAGIKVKAVIGDGAYSEKDNIKYAKENKIELVSKLSKTVTHGHRKKEDEFEYNKDAQMYVCKAGHMAIKKAKVGSKKDKKGIDTRVESYYFDVEKCKKCPYQNGCYKPGSKTKTYSIKIKDDIHIEHMDYVESERFKELYAQRYKIEAKNAEIKERYNYETAQASGLLGMNVQGATALFMSNIKRIIKLKEEKK